MSRSAKLRIRRRSRGPVARRAEAALYEQWWHPSGEAKAVVLIVHGYAEHSGRYAHVAEHLTRHGYAVYAFDLIGHGRSPGARTYVSSFDVYLEGLEQSLERVREREPGKPVFLLGHSMGGAVVTLFAVTRQPALRGVVLSGPSLKISDAISPLLVRLSAVLGRLVPRLRTIKLDSRALSRDPEVVARYENDPLVYRRGIPARTGAEINRATREIRAQMASLALPLLILHGTEDRLADPEGSRQLYRRARSEDKTLKLYEGFYHEVLNEPGKDRVLADLTDWLEARA